MGEEAYEDYLEKLDEEKEKEQEEQYKRSRIIDFGKIEEDIVEYEEAAKKNPEMQKLVDSLKEVVEKGKITQTINAPKPKKVRPNRSLKKIVTEMNAQIKAELGQADESKGGKKKHQT